MLRQPRKMISQKITYFKDYTIKTYTEWSDSVETVFKRYDKFGRIVLLRYGTGEWERWKYDNFMLVSNKKSNGEFLIRRFDETGRMTYEETHEGVSYDPTLKRKLK